MIWESKRFSGLLCSKLGFVFATGTPDEMGRAFGVYCGEVVWKREMVYEEFGPPMPYM
jgi:hypothetical protein